MTREEATITSKIYSVAGKGGSRFGLMRERPFRAPHNSSSLPAFLGGGSGDNIMPGEVSLATNGVLFIDELSLTPRSVLEALRGPLEDRKVTISRLKAKVEYPASFMLVAASNPCPCGYFGEGERCTCTPGQRAAYLSRLSGPVMDRLDLQVLMHPVDPSKLIDGIKEEPSKAIAERVAKAREIQRERFKDIGIFCNSEMSSKEMEAFCPLNDACKDVLGKIMKRSGLSARAFSRIIRIARTIADLEAVSLIDTTRQDPGPILPRHLLEAASYRFLDKANIFEI